MKTQTPHKKFAAFDIDGTLMRWQLFHTVVNELARRNRVTMNEYKTMVELLSNWKRRSEPSSFYAYDEAAIKTWFAIIKTLSLEEYHDAIQKVFEKQKDFTYSYTRQLIRTLKNDGYTILAISGSHQEIVQLVAEYYGFDIAIGTTYPVKNGKFTGEEITPVTAKGEVLRTFVERYNLDWKESYAVGDSRSDAKMLELVDHPIAFNPDENLLALAKAHGWTIVIERKNVTHKLVHESGSYTLAE
ncbi:MAG: HAD family hydrolase [Candidatus Saccharimonadales bacterium]